MNSGILNTTPVEMRNEDAMLEAFRRKARRENKKGLSYLWSRLIQIARQSYVSLSWQGRPLFRGVYLHRDFRGTMELGAVVFGIWLSLVIDYSR
jgi:hypothetical protein